MIPTADDIARAVVAACRETGEDPVAMIESRLMGIRARHYAMHALLHVFPDLGREAAARVVGCPGKPGPFWANSWNQTVKPRASGLGHVANWFDDDAYARVIAAIEGTKPKPVPYKPGPLPPAPSSPGYRPPAGTIARALADDAEDERPVFDRGGSFAGPKPKQHVASSKRELKDMLAEAARRTAALSKPDTGS